MIALLLAARLEEVAKFIALGTSLQNVLLFISYQIPYILQIALPIAALIGAYSSLSFMNQNGEVTAMRACGYNLSTLLFPIMMISALLALGMAWIGFDMAAYCHLATKKLVHDVREQEPLSFMQNSQFLGKHGIALELSGSLHCQEKANNLLLCIPSQDRLMVIIMKQTHAQKEALLGNNVSLISTKAPQEASDTFGSLFIENADIKKTPLCCVHELTEQKNWKIPPDHLSLAVVRARTQELQQLVAQQQYKGHEAKKLKKELAKFISEPFRRLSLSTAIFTLSVIGALAGVRVNKNEKKHLSLLAPAISFICFIGFYLAGKNLDAIPYLAITCYIVPHILLFKAASIWKQELEQGIG